MHSTDTIGSRIRQARTERGFSRDEVAERCGISAGFLARLERGEREPSVATVYALAGALGTTVPWLLDHRERLAKGGRDHGILPVRDVLLALGDLPGMDLDGDGEPAPLDELDRAVAGCWDLYWAGRLGHLASALPHLITTARASERELGAAACRPLAQACQLAADLMVHMGNDDLAYIAARSALLAAYRGDDPVQHATLGGTLAWVLLHAGRLTEAERVAAAAAEKIRPSGRVPLAHLCVHGALLLSAAAPAAAAGNAGAVREYMAEAQVTALQFTEGDRHDYMVSFGPSQVAMQRCHQQAVLHEPGEALRAAKRVRRGDLLQISWGAHHLDVAQANLERGKAGGAIDALWEAREVSPEWARHQGLFRSLVASASSAESRMSERARKLRATAGIH